MSLERTFTIETDLYHVNTDLNNKLFRIFIEDQCKNIWGTPA